MANVSAALVPRASDLCDDVYEVIQREILELHGDRPVPFCARWSTGRALPGGPGIPRTVDAGPDGFRGSQRHHSYHAEWLPEACRRDGIAAGDGSVGSGFFSRATIDGAMGWSTKGL
jgi:hypothetical protein